MSPETICPELGDPLDDTRCGVLGNSVVFIYYTTLLVFVNHSYTSLLLVTHFTLKGVVSILTCCYNSLYKL